MWICTHCGSEVAQSDVEIDVDHEEGCYFICPSCEARNPLVNVGGGGADDEITLIQPEPLQPPRK